MWWKLGLLAFGTLAVILLLLPFRTHAVMYRPGIDPAPDVSLSFGRWVENLYLTSGTVVMICAVLLVAAGIAWRIVRAS